MRLFVVPSWWPHRCYPWEGVFIQEQVRAITQLRPTWRIAIDLWGQGETFVSSAHVRKSPRCLAGALALRAGEHSTAPNVLELTTPALWWPERWMGGNRRALVAAGEENLRRAVARFGGIDVIHAHGSYPGGWVAMALSRAHGIPYVITEHMGPFPLPVYARRNGALIPALREPLAHADARIAVSPTLARTIAGFGLPEPEAIPNLVDERLYTAGPRRADDRFVFYTLGLIDPTKGIGDLIEAAAVFLRGLPEAARTRVQFRIGGTGPALGTFRARAEQLGIAAHVAWLGQLPREQARAEFATCDCFVLPSHHESFGIVYVEAAASGRPVIATRAGGPEWIVTPETGVLVPPRDVAALAQALGFMHAHAAEYDAAAIRARPLERYSRAAVVDRLEQVYRRVTRAARTPAG